MLADLTQAPAANAGDLLNTVEAATLLGLAPRTLTNWRDRKCGPAFVKIGKRAVRYRRADLELFILHVPVAA